MRFHHCLFSIVSAFAVLTAALFAVEPAPPTPPAKFTFPAYIPDDCDNLFVLGDVLPPMRRMLNSATFRHFAAEGLLPRRISRSGDDISQSLVKLEANKQFVPAEVVIGFPSGTYDGFVNIAKLALGIGLCNAATQTGETAVENELPALQTIVLEAALAAKSPRLTAWVRFRDPQTAGALIAAIAMGAPQLSRPDVEVNVTGDKVSLKCVVGKVWTPQIIAAVLARYGVAAEVDDPRLAEISAALANFQVDVWVEKLDDGIRFTLGTQPIPFKISVRSGAPIHRCSPMANGSSATLRLAPNRL